MPVTMRQHLLALDISFSIIKETIMSSVDIYAILASKSHNEYYLKKYFKFILDCIHSNSSKTKEELGYTEQHHFCPRSKSLFPEYKEFKDFPWNKVILTARQHFIAHWMLWKTFGKSMTQAFNRMRTSKQNNGIISSNVYAKLRCELAIYLSQREITDQTRMKMSKSARSRPPISEETRKKKSECHKGKPKTEEHKAKIRASNIGKIVSEETRKKISDTNKGHVPSEETKKKISDSHKGKPKTDDHKKNIALGKAHKTIYHFIHKITSEEFVGTRYEFRLEKGFPLDPLFQTRQMKSCKGWTIKNNQDQIQELLDTSHEVYHIEDQTSTNFPTHLEI